jgi:hypothetical protein
MAEIITDQKWKVLASFNHRTGQIIVHPRFHKLSEPMKLLIVTQLENLKQTNFVKDYLEADTIALQKVWETYPDTPKEELIDEFLKSISVPYARDINNDRTDNFMDFLKQKGIKP